MSASAILRELARAGERVAPKAPGPLGTALELGALGLGLIATILDAGGDPKIVIPRLADLLPSILAVQASRQKRLDARFPDADTEPSPPPSHVMDDEDVPE